jgi:eukaryotic-like serine/threonine-protein kinase
VAAGCTVEPGPLSANSIYAGGLGLPNLCRSAAHPGGRLALPRRLLLVHRSQKGCESSGRADEANCLPLPFLPRGTRPGAARDPSTKEVADYWSGHCSPTAVRSHVESFERDITCSSGWGVGQLPGDIERYLGSTVCGRYELESLIAEGGMGVVFQARHLVLDQPIALKLVRPAIARDPNAVARFLDEARVIARMRSPHAARVFDSGRAEDGTPYMALELLNGCDLRSLLDRNGPVCCEQAAEYVIQACHAMCEAHALGVVHRDLKPENLFLHRAEDGSRVIKVLDFGISKYLNFELRSGGRAHTHAGEIVGSPHYMSPEQMSAECVDARADIWALGVVLFELVTGEVPFPGESIGEVCALLFNGEVPALSRFRSEVPVSFERITRRCLSKNRAERYQDANELADALRQFLRDPSGARTRSGGPERPHALSWSMLGPALATARSIFIPAARHWRSALGFSVIGLVAASASVGPRLAPPSAMETSSAAVVSEPNANVPVRTESSLPFLPVQLNAMAAAAKPEVVPVPTLVGVNGALQSPFHADVAAPPSSKKGGRLSPAKAVPGLRTPNVMRAPAASPPAFDQLIPPYPTSELRADVNSARR